MLVPKVGFSRLEGGSIVGFGSVRDWLTNESTETGDAPILGTHGDTKFDGLRRITIGHDYDVFAAPRQQA